jgi:hypothetical protein
MFDVMMWLIVIPTVITAIKFWVRLGRWGLKSRRDIASRVQRVRSAYAAASGVEE